MNTYRLRCPKCGAWHEMSLPFKLTRPRETKFKCDGCMDEELAEMRAAKEAGTSLRSEEEII